MVDADIPRKRLGTTGIDVTTVGMGGAWLGRLGDDVDEDLGLQTIWAGLEAGISLIDTAPLYIATRSEQIVGRALRERPDLAAGVVLETKCCRHAEGTDYSYDAAMRSVDGSLERLGRSRLELLYIHDPPAGAFDQVMGSGGALQALRALQTQGVVAHVGIASNYPEDNAPYVESGEFEMAAVPDAYSLLNQVALERIFPAAQRFDMGVVVATPYEKGLLAVGTGGVRERPELLPATRRFSGRVLERVGEIEALCAEYRVSLAAVALQFVVRSPVVTTCIPGPRTPAEARANADAARARIPDALWQQLEPLVESWDIVAR
jgi:D-threo-aldose 1-dehydrogenase